jgi:alpha-galactosidase
MITLTLRSIVRRLGLFAVLVSLCCNPSLFAADVTGHWRVSRQTDDGNTLETFLDLKQEGSKLTGTVLVSWGDLQISDGQVDDNRISFTADAFRYDGDIAGDRMNLTQHDPNIGAISVSAMRMPAHAVPSPARLPVPPLHVVPNNGLASTPPMGWNSWNFFHDKIDDPTVRQIADAMVARGMRDVGYAYVNVDDTWQGSRDANGRIRPNKKFPDMKALVDYVHAKGLKIGIYSSPGPKTCGGYEGSYGHEEQDARTFAEWGIDYVKYDWCSAFRIYHDSEMRAVYQKMGDALRESGRPMVYSLCQYGKEDVWKWGKLVGGNLWRTTNDIEDNALSMFRNAEAEVDLAPWAEPGHWNDPDMLETGNGSMSADEYRAHMTFWSILAAPLIAGNDLRNMTQETRAILTNSEVIAIDQDALGKQGRRMRKNGNVEVWTRPLVEGAVALAIFNLGVTDTPVTVSWQDLGISNVKNVRDLWAQRDLPDAGIQYSGTVKGHGAQLVRLETRR